MRVAHINLSAELHGGEHQTLALTRALTTEVDQRLILRRGSRLLERAAQLRGCQIRPVANSLIAAAQATQDCDLVHIHDGRSTKAGALASLWGRPFIVTRRSLKPPSNKLLTRWCYGRAAGLVGVSAAVSEAMQDYIGDSHRVETIYDGVKLPEPTVGNAHQENQPQRPFVVACVGELDDATKAQSTVFAAARLLRKRYPQIAFWIVGRGKDEARMRAMAADLPNVRFGGWTADMASCYRDIDLLAHPARSEALGSVILEAMSHSIPVIGTAVGGIPEIIRPDHNGALIEVDDGQALADKIVKLYSDPVQLAKLGTNAHETALRFSATTMAQRYAALYREVLATQQPLAAHGPFTIKN